MAGAVATVYGAVSLVNAIATGRGATLGVRLRTVAEAESEPGSGVVIESENRTISSRLISRTVEKIVPKRELAGGRIRIRVSSEVPTGYGLKSSSAISSAVALACARAFRPSASDRAVLAAGVDASVETGISMTGAYDDACACYYGGFAVTDNLRRRLVASKRAPRSVRVAIFIPRSRKRGDARKLRDLGPAFESAWKMARDGDHWNAMTLNGLAASFVLGPGPETINSLIRAGALGASVSGNGPAIAAVGRPGDMPRIKRVFSGLEGRTVICQTNNTRRDVRDL